MEEVSHLEEVVESLCKLTTSPERLPTASEQVIEDAKMGYALMSESIYGYHVSTLEIFALNGFANRKIKTVSHMYDKNQTCTLRPFVKK